MECYDQILEESLKIQVQQLKNPAPKNSNIDYARSAFTQLREKFIKNDKQHGQQKAYPWWAVRHAPRPIVGAMASSWPKTGQGKGTAYYEAAKAQKITTELAKNLRTKKDHNEIVIKKIRKDHNYNYPKTGQLHKAVQNKQKLYDY